MSIITPSKTNVKTPPTSQVTRVALYSRVSSLEQAREGVSLGEQRERLELLAKLEDWQVYDRYQDEGVSGGTDNRPHLQRIMADARAGRIDLVAVTKIDRFFRNTRLLLDYIHELKSCNVAFVAQSEGLDTRKSGINKMMMSFFGSVAEWEHDRISERVSDFRNHLAAKGRWSSGRTTFGYRFNKELKELEVCEPEANAVAFAFRHYIEDRLGLLRLADLMNNENLIAPGKNIWIPSTVLYILRHSSYMGGPNDSWQFKCPAIVDAVTWKAAQRQLSNNRHFRPASNPSPYQGLLRCGLCGRTLRMGYNHSTRRVWECSGRLKTNHLDGSARCTLPRFEAITFEKQLDSETNRVFNDPELFRQHLTHTMENLKQERDELERRLRPIHADIQRIENSMSIADAKLEAGRLDSSTYKAIIAGLRSKLRDLERRQEQADPMMLMDIALKDTVIFICEDILKTEQPKDVRKMLEYEARIPFSLMRDDKRIRKALAPIALTKPKSLHSALRQFGFAVEVHPSYVEVKGLLGNRQTTISPAYST